MYIVAEFIIDTFVIWLALATLNIQAQPKEMIFACFAIKVATVGWPRWN